MKPYHDGMALVAQLFETFERKGMPERELDSMAQWLEEILPHYLRRRLKRGDQLDQVFLNTERLIPALKRRAKALGFG